MLFEIHDFLSNRCDDGGVRHTDHRHFVIDELQGRFVNLGALALIDSLFSLQDQLAYKYDARMNRLLELLTSQKVILAVSQASNEAAFSTRNPWYCMQSDGDCTCTSLGTTVFTQEVKAELKTLLTFFAQDTQHQLQKVIESITTP